MKLLELGCNEAANVSGLGLGPPMHLPGTQGAIHGTDEKDPHLISRSVGYMSWKSISELDIRINQKDKVRH